MANECQSIHCGGVDEDTGLLLVCDYCLLDEERTYSAEIKDIRAERDRWREDWKTTNAALADAQDDVQKLRAENARLAGVVEQYEIALGKIVDRTQGRRGRLRFCNRTAYAALQKGGRGC